ncbi:MAG: hypothetical protein AAFQ09_07240, partial [Pseudomonadota bacterium]
MSLELERAGVYSNKAPVFVANHYRAIADIAVAEVQAERLPKRVTNRCINQWLDTYEQIQTLSSE